MWVELYQVKCPRNIVFGDPMYFEEYTGERLKELTVDYNPPQYFEAGVVLKEEEIPEYPGFVLRSMCVYLAPKETISTYMSGMMYEGQQTQQKNVGVDSASYMIAVDGRRDDIHTGGDGYWGDMQTFYRMDGQQKIEDAVILTVVLPDFMDATNMRQWMNDLFEDVQLLTNHKRESKKDMPQR